MFVKTMTSEPWNPWTFLRAPDDESGQGAPPDTGADDDADTDEGDGDAGGDTGRTYTQRDMDRIRLRETRKAQAAGKREALKELGIEDPAEAKRIIEAARKVAEKDKSEQDRLREKATQAETAAQQAKREAAEARLSRTVDRALVKAGVAPARLDRIARLVHGELDGDEPDEDDIKAAIESVKDDFPESFAGDDGDGDDRGRRRGAPSGEGRGGTPPKGQRGGGKEDPMARGAERARKMQGRTAATA